MPMESWRAPGRVEVCPSGPTSGPSERSVRLRDYVRADPDNLALVCALIDELLATQRSRDALAVIDQLHATLKQRPEVCLREARAFMAERTFERALACLRPLLQQGLDTPAIRHDLAFVQLCMGDWDGALRTLAPVLALDAPPVECEVLRARILQARGEGTRALEVLARPDLEQSPSLLGLRALLLLDTGDRERARTFATACLEQQSDQMDASLVEGTLALWAGDLTTADQAFARVLKAAPDTGRALSGRGQIQWLQGDLSAARGTFEAAVAVMPGHIGTWHALAWACLLEGDVSGASAAFESAYALDRTFGETHGGLALIHVLRHQPAEAEQAIRRAQKLDPTSRNARYARSLLWLERGQPEAAAQEVESILEHTALPPGVSTAAFLKQLQRQIQRTG